MKRMITLREIIKWGFLTLISGLALVHVFGNKAVWAPLDAYCPFGSLESGWKLITQGGFLEKIQPSNLALLVALIVTTLLFGGIFCGWICPLGTLQDCLNWIAKKLHLPQIKVSPKWDRYLRWLRLPFLALVLFESYLLVKLWFADYDPFRLIFGFHWLSEPEKILTTGWVIMGAFLILSLFWRRFWCKYLCPFGLVVQVLSKISLFRIRWRKEECRECDICTKNCPMGLTVTDPKLNSSACNNCLQCVSVCPAPKALQYQTKFAGGSTLAGIGTASFVVILIIAQFAGWWNPKIGSDPESIKGWMTLGHVAETYFIPLEAIKEEQKLPDSSNAETELRSFESTVPGFSMVEFREYVAKRIGKSNLSGGETKLAAGERIESKTTTKDTPEKNEPENIKPSPANSLRETKPEPVTENSPKKDTSAHMAPDTAEITGAMTLKEISEGWKIPLPALIESLGIPKDADPNIPIREYHTPYGFGAVKVREVVQSIISK